MNGIGNLIHHGEILTIQTPTGSVVGFHARSLEVASLDKEIWNSLVAARGAIGGTADNGTADNGTAEIGSTANTGGTANVAALQELEEWSRSLDPRSKSGRVEHGIRSLTINVAQVCNLACTYCAAGGDGTYGSAIKKPELDRVREQLAMLLSHIPANERFVITFLGGEPLLVPELIKTIARDARLMVAGRDIKLRFDIVTNGTLVTPKIAELLASLNAHVTVSIDGAPEDHDRARLTKSGKGSSQDVLKGIDELMKVRDQLHSLNAGAVFGAHNLNVVKAYEFLAKFPFDSIKFDFAAEQGDELASREYAAQVAAVADLAWARGGERELRRLAVFNHLFHALDDQVRIENHCLAGKSHLQLDTEGRFTACQWFVGDEEEELGRDLTINLDRLKEYDEPLISKHGCGTCWARHLCGGGCMFVNKVKNGNKHKVDYAFCERTRTILAKGIERYAESRYNRLDANGTDRGARTGERHEVY